MKFCLILLALFAVSCARPIRRAAIPPPPASGAPLPVNHARLAKPSPGEEDEGEDDPKKFYLLQRLPAGMTELPADRYAAAREHVAAMPRISAASSLPRPTATPRFAATTSGWTSLGPGNIGGRTRSLVINPQDANIMYAGAVTGGVWKTTDGGQSWVPLFDSQTVLNIGSLVMDPADPDTIYAGTGEWYTGFPGDGIYKTTNGGTTWLPLASTTNSSFYYVNKLVISPTNNQRIYAATWNGVWTSANGGTAWTQILTTKTAYAGCQDLVIRPDLSTDVLTASCTGATAPGTATGDYQILQNTTAPSSTWVQVQTQPHLGRTSLAIAPSQPATIYAMAADYDTTSPFNNGLLAVYRSASGGGAGTWTTQVSNTDPNPVNSLLLSNLGSSVTDFCNNGGPVVPSHSQGGYDNVLAVDPLNSNTVWAGGLELSRSDDGGVTWGIASYEDVAFGNPQYAAQDRHVIVFHPGYNGSTNQTMFLGDDGGVYRTDNARAAVATGPRAVCFATFQANSAVRWTNLTNSYVTTQFYRGFAYPGGMAYMGGEQDNATSRGTDAGGLNGWARIGGSDGTAVALDPFDANHVLKSTQNLGLQTAINGGTFLPSVAGITEVAANFPFVPRLAMDPNEGDRLYLGGTTNLWRSLDGAATWTAAAPVEASSSVSAIAVSPVDSNTVLFGTRMGFIYRNSAAVSSNGSIPWASSQPRKANVSGLSFDPANPQIVYASYSTLKSIASDAHVYKSLDGGVTWAPSDGTGSSTLPDTPVFRLLVNPYNPSTLYLGSDLGLFVSTDGGATWGHDPNEFSAVIVEDLAFDQVANPNWLFAFTYGRGAYRTPLSGSPSPNCSYHVSPTTISADGYGSVVPVTISAPSGCAWVGIPGTAPAAFQVQSPAQGVGNGTAFVNIEPNAGASRSDTLNIANTAVIVNQSAAASVTRTLGDLATAPVTLTAPGIAQIGSSSLTSSAGDPVHSCTGSADFKTAWWRVTPASSGILQILAAGRRSDVTGNSGIALTAYPASSTSKELACATVAQDTRSQIDAVIRFSVSAGTAYLVEVSALGQASTFNATVTVAATLSGSPDVTLSVTPATTSTTAGGNATQFTAQVANAANAAVRWSISPPIGVISPAGVYTPPASLSAPAQVTVTATTFALPRKQATATISVMLPTGTSGPTPAIASVTNAASGATSIAPNGWVTITGTNLAPDTRVWQDTDFVAGQMPTELDGVSATIDGHKAYVFYISPTQVNVLAPLDAKVGSVPVVLATTNGSSAPATVSQTTYTPSFFLFAGKYAAATHVNGTLLGPTALYPGASTPAAPGETVVLYGNGFGEVAPGIVPGSASQSGTLPVAPAFSIGGLSASVQFAGAISPGLYQFNIVVPVNAPNGDNTLTVTYQGASGPTGVFLTVGN